MPKAVCCEIDGQAARKVLSHMQKPLLLAIRHASKSGFLMTLMKLHLW